ncbi:ABC transporter ATP-binding protein [Actinobacteria bacterium YIM 96077]|uniref:ABC transporter ATP-binding protein n=1 Tax=Phytoactinopolyspora halophila TaxID=1981511 RepID=A0A329QSX8_9ACTN|nr:ABC transporter ATP-binding protein [Phytoactinopolyspora halophila]AYY15745.1 ABC transporter ATP-binding protein [Actinobacteria bacterium YIM 96077]RAW15484.1 ABC transporter ATP-binding protein [Phytoactinopolyspora halophila]
MEASPAFVRADESCPGKRGLLRASDVTKSFGPTVALHGGELCVSAGEIVAVMGPSGSGKSTLLHCLAGVLLPDQGLVEYDGQRLDAMSDAERSRLRRTDFGFVYQFGQLVPELTAVENTALPLLLERRRRREAVAVAQAWLETFGLAGLEKRRPGELSGGEAQRVAVARALVTDPRVIFADEPTGSLDSAAGVAVLDEFTGAVRSRGVAVVLVTHDARVAAYAERTVLVRDGMVTSPDTARTVRAS